VKEEDNLPAHVAASSAAAALLRRLRQRHGPLLFHLSSGCCDGTAPMCLRQSDFHPGASDVLLGSLEGVPFYTSSWQAQLLGDVSLLIDVVESQSDSFSLEAAEGIRFIARTVETR